MDSGRVEIPGSELKGRTGEHALSPATPSEPVDATIFLRRNPHAGGPSEEDLLSGRYQAGGQGGGAAVRAAMAADPNDVAAVRSFAEQYGLKIVEEDPASRRVRVQGSASAMEKAFAIRLQQEGDANGRSYRTYRGAISVPKALGGIVTAVLGLDQRPVASPLNQ